MDYSRCQCCGMVMLACYWYNICDNCFWEQDPDCLMDTGSGVELDLDWVSDPNHMTLGEGRLNYALHGACKIDFADVCQEWREKNDRA